MNSDIGILTLVGIIQDATGILDPVVERVVCLSIPACAPLINNILLEVCAMPLTEVDKRIHVRPKRLTTGDFSVFFIQGNYFIDGKHDRKSYVNSLIDSEHRFNSSRSELRYIRAEEGSRWPNIADTIAGFAPVSIRDVAM